ncbi:hypothetical protein CTA2_4802 [Colletotrichum tanaceti]|uniref:Uncharacterized protein n=1 Tax=Colletotrichum tanaceti TaxID=1306861 RepID=A0A4U6XE54_9PEZI|nr:hypothetical protein CTA2_4802 [Colletotrichum tanaceti]TKW53663.1 hypothetical protein CTA1_5492 [Colletotrichum tanaceti]
MTASTSLSSEADSVLEPPEDLYPGPVTMLGGMHLHDPEKPNQTQVLGSIAEEQEAQNFENTQNKTHETFGSLPIRAWDGQQSERQVEPGSGGGDANSLFLHDTAVVGTHLDDTDVQSQHLSKPKLRSIVSNVRDSQRELVQRRIDKARQNALSRFTTQATTIIHGMSQIQETADQLVKTAIDNEYRQLKADKRGDAQSRLENALAEHSVIEKVDEMLENFNKSMLPEPQTKSM